MMCDHMSNLIDMLCRTTYSGPGAAMCIYTCTDKHAHQQFAGMVVNTECPSVVYIHVAVPSVHHECVMQASEGGKECL